MSAGEATLGGEDYAKLLDCDLVDEVLLFRAFGISRQQRRAFASLYGRLDPAHRPALSPFFDPVWYLSKDQTLRERAADPFLHFIAQGIFELRSPHPFVSLERIYDDNRVLFYREGGCRSLLRVLTENISDPSAYFDLDFYLNRYEEARQYPGGALRHFLEIGRRRWLFPNGYFDPGRYAERHSESASDSVSALRHFIEEGGRHLYVPIPGFDPDFYLLAGPEASGDGAEPLHHYLPKFRREASPPLQAQCLARGFFGGRDPRSFNPPEQPAWPRIRCRRRGRSAEPPAFRA